MSNPEAIAKMRHFIETIASMTTPTDGVSDSAEAEEILAELDDHSLCHAAKTFFALVREARKLDRQLEAAKG